MSNRQIAAGLFRAWAVMWSIYVLLALPQFVNALIRNPYSGSEKATESYLLSSQAIAIGCEIVVVIFLIRKAEWLATLVFPVEQSFGLSLTAHDLQAVLFSIIGLYFLLDGGKHTIGIAYQLLAGSRGDTGESLGYLWQQQPENLARALGGTILGALVLFRRRKGSSPWARIRRSYQKWFGLRESPDEE